VTTHLHLVVWNPEAERIIAVGPARRWQNEAALVPISASDVLHFLIRQTRCYSNDRRRVAASRARGEDVYNMDLRSHPFLHFFEIAGTIPVVFTPSKFSLRRRAAGVSPSSLYTAAMKMIHSEPICAPRDGCADVNARSNNDDQKVQKINVFISYSRDDQDFAERLDAASKERLFETLVDRTSIYAFEDWWERIQDLIVRADTIVFIISPNSIRSNVCEKKSPSLRRSIRDLLQLSTSGRTINGFRRRFLVSTPSSSTISSNLS